MARWTRRALLQGAAGLGAAALLPGPALAAKKRFRFAHITDLHIQPELGAAEGVAMAVRKLLSLRPRPEFVLVGGDSVMDLLAVARPRADIQFRLLEEALKPLEMPIHYALGNHDVYGWGSKDETQAREPDYGKKMFAERVAKGPTYHAFDFQGWHFVLLDSIAKAPNGWHAEIDDAQLQWLKDDLARSGKQRPIVLVCHVPLMTIFTQYTVGSTFPSPDSLVVRNGKEVRDLFTPYPVKAVLQGHTHVVEECIYTGTRYITSGAICGDWWKGPRLGVHPEGFAVFDVEGDSLRWEYVPYGWKARAPAPAGKGA